MGGRALKSVDTRRINRVEFDRISKEIMNILKLTFNKVGIPFFYKKKESFGDIDFVISNDGFNGSIREYIENTFTPNEIFHNGNAYSFDYESVQIDLIFTPDEDYESTLNYMGGNDLGNFIGRLAQSLGFKYGQEGLWYNHYSDANTKTTIMVSKDYREIFSFLDLDYDKWIEGFDSLEEIFEYVMTSFLFNPKIFQLKELNKINRERNLKRASYMSFLEYIEDKEPNDEYDGEVIYTLKKDVINVIREAFPSVNIDLRLAEIDYETAKKKLVNMKFNGKTIMEKFELEGKELGNAIKAFKDIIINHSYDGIYDDFNVYILETDVEQIYEDFSNGLTWGF